MLLPAAYILPKGSKGFKKARPVIPFQGYFLKTLHRASGKALCDLGNSVLQGSSFNASSTLHAIPAIRSFPARAKKLLEQRGCSTANYHFEFANEDISAFFLAPSHDQLLSAARWVIANYLNSRPVSSYGQPVVFTVLLGRQTRRCVGSKCADPAGVRLPLKFLVPILEHALLASLCMVGGRVVRQVRGAFIGSPLSPPWCTLVVMLAEHQWLTSLSSSVPHESLWVATRYVDSRMRVCLTGPDICTDCPLKHASSTLRSLHREGFYGDTIFLEAEPGTDLVGVRIWSQGLDINGLYI